MSKKILIPVVIAVIAALAAGAWTVSAAPAEQQGPGGFLGKLRQLREHATFGKVTAVAESAFTIQTAGGEEKTFQVDENTKYRSKLTEEASFADLSVGQWVAVIAPKDEEDAIARAVITLPEDFDPAKLVRRIRQAGRHIIKENRSVGEITAIDSAASTITLATKDGEELTFTVDENTKFRGRDGEVQSLADLEVGMMAVIIARPSEDGSVKVAAAVLAEHKEDLPIFDKKVAGTVVSVGEDSFTIETRSGEQLTFTVTAETKFKSRGGQVQGLSDLKEGMKVFVGAKALGSGQLQAQLVVAGPPPQ